jgi:hypothetical protein
VFRFVKWRLFGGYGGVESNLWPVGEEVIRKRVRYDVPVFQRVLLL